MKNFLTHKIVFIGGSTTKGHQCAGKAFPNIVAKEVNIEHVNIFSMNSIKVSDLDELFKREKYSPRQGDVFVLQIGPGDHAPILRNKNFDKAISGKSCRRLLRKLGFAKNSTPFSDYERLVQKFVSLLLNTGVKVIWITSLVGYRRSPVERKRKLKYVKPSKILGQEPYKSKINLIDLNELLTLEERGSDSVHPNAMGQIHIANTIMEMLEKK